MMKKIAIAVMILAAAWSAHATILTWNTTTGDYGTAGNWDPVQAPTSADEVRLDNGGTATISSGSHNADKLYMGRLASNSGSLSMSGGSLTVATAGYVASASGTSGNLTMTGSSTLNVGNIQVGARGTGVMSVGSDASVSSANLYMSSAGGGVGTLDLAGDWSASKVLIGHDSNASVSSVFNLNGGSLTASSEFTVNALGSHALNVNGSTGAFSADSFSAANGNFTLGFVADAGGFTTLTVADTIDIDGATLNVDLSAYGGVLGIKLMDGASLAGTFGAINITGGTGSESISYDTVNGDLVLIPEPASLGLIGLAGVSLLYIRRIFII